MRFLRSLAGALLLCATTALHAEGPVESAHDLVKDVVYNELHERTQVSLWQYRVEKRVGSQTVTEQQVETTAGPVFRVLARQGTPLDAAAQKRETDRLLNLLHNSSEQARMKQDHLAEEARVERLIGAMPDAFLYAYDGMRDGSLQLSFRPNPGYSPPTYEARVFHGLAGEILIQPQLKRLVEIDGHIDSEIDFGFGLLGKIEKGGTFKIGRQPAGDARWKTTLIDVHIAGRIVFFKDISKDQRELRSDFKPVAPNFSLKEAVALLNSESPQ